MRLIKSGAIILIVGLIGVMLIVGCELYAHRDVEPVSYTAQEISAMLPEAVNINTASKDELLTLSALTEKQAQSIIAYREAHGGFTSIEELLKVEGIGKVTFERIKLSVTIE